MLKTVVLLNFLFFKKNMFSGLEKFKRKAFIWNIIFGDNVEVFTVTSYYLILAE